MNSLCALSHCPVSFFVGYLRRRPISHAVIFLAVLAAVACSIGAQYGIKFLVDTLAGGSAAAASVWLAFGLLVTLIACDNLDAEFRGRFWQDEIIGRNPAEVVYCDTR